MKKFILYTLLFFTVVAVVDFAAGKVFYYLQSRAGGRTGAEWYACKESHEDIIIMGSSRASHHYVPQIFEDSLGLSCFNAGQDGNGIILQYGRWKMIRERYTPKMVIYDVTYNFDLGVNDNMTYIDRLKPFCKDRKVKSYVACLYPMESLKLLSKMYCYNYKFLEIFTDCLKSKDDSRKGYIPLYGTIRQEVVNGYKGASVTESNYDLVKLTYLEIIAQECEQSNTKLVFVVSPMFRGGTASLSTFQPVKQIAEKYGARFLYYYDSDLALQPELFEDSNHLNDKGAVAFTKDLVNKLK